MSRTRFRVNPHSIVAVTYSYHLNYYKLIGIDLSRKTNTNIPQQVNFTGKLEEDNGAAMFFNTGKQ